MKPEFAVIEARGEDIKYLTIDTAQATLQGFKWHDLSDYGKRKFENMLIITNSPQKVTPIYV